MDQALKVQTQAEKNQKLKDELNALYLQLQEEQEHAVKLYERGKKYKQRLRLKEEEMRALKEEVRSLIDQRNGEINQIREQIDS